MTWIVFDLEATCWSESYPPRRQEIIEYGAVVLSDFGKEIDQWSQMIRPEVHPYLSAYCTTLTGISQDEVDNALNFRKFHRRYASWLDRLPRPHRFMAWGHDDLRLWTDSCHHDGIEDDMTRTYMDVKRVYHDIFGIQRAIGLYKVLKRESIEAEGERHRALPDAYNLSLLIRHHIGIWPID